MKTVRCTASALIVRALPAGTDTGRRLIRGQVAESYGESYDRKWAHVLAPAGEGWASTLYLDAATPAAPHSAWPAVPHGLVVLRETFGEPGNPRCSSGIVHLPAALPFWDGVKRSRFACHELMVPVFTSFFRQIHDRGFWNLLHTFDGCYNKRLKTGTVSKWSTHSWGIAIDVNAATNGFGRRPQLDPRIVAIGQDHMLTWGGAWATPDGMHFQFATGY